MGNGFRQYPMVSKYMGPFSLVGPYVGHIFTLKQFYEL